MSEWNLYEGTIRKRRLIWQEYRLALCEHICSHCENTIHHGYKYTRIVRANGSQLDIEHRHETPGCP